MGTLDGKVALVTGAGRGIGRGIARLMAREGAALVINDLGSSLDGKGADVAVAEQTAREIDPTGEKVVFNTNSVADFDGAGAMVQQAIDSFGKIDIVVNVAGILRDRMIFNMTPEEWHAVIDVHLKGTFNTCHWASIRFREQGFGGRLINFSSSSAFGAPGQPNYAAAKAGIIGLTLSCATGLSRLGVTANAILPGASTRMIDSIPKVREAALEQTGKLPSELAVGTERDPDNVAPIVAFLASDAAANVNGHLFAASGYNITMMAQPKIIKELKADHRWTVDELAELVPRAFADELAVVQNNPGFGEKIRTIPAEQWTELAPELRFWGTKIAPYGEQVW